jgi:hypothetical protein
MAPLDYGHGREGEPPRRLLGANCPLTTLSLAEALGLLPDVLRLLRRLAGDRHSREVCGSGCG